MAKRSWILYTIVCVLALLVSACWKRGPPPPPPPTKVLITVRSANDLNPDITGRASPILLRVYELKGRNAFIGADFFPLYQDERSVLTDDLLGKEELLVRPGETRQISRTLDAQTQHIGFFAAYRDLDNAMWRSTLPVLAHQLTPIEVHLGRLNLKARVSSR